MSAENTSAYVFVEVQAKGSGDVVAIAMRRFPEVTEAAAVFGHMDVVLKVEGVTDERLYSIVMDGIQDIEGVDSSSTFIAFPGLHAESTVQTHRSLKAYVTVELSKGNAGRVIKHLVGDLDEIVEGAVVAGDVDIVLKVEVDDHIGLESVVMNEIQTIEDVKVTRTFPIINKFHQWRDA